MSRPGRWWWRSAATAPTFGDVLAAALSAQLTLGEGGTGHQRAARGCSSVPGPPIGEGEHARAYPPTDRCALIRPYRQRGPVPTIGSAPSWMRARTQAFELQPPFDQIRPASPLTKGAAMLVP